MSIKAQEIVIPCLPFSVRARLGTKDDSLTPIERITLQAIGHGLSHVGTLSDVLGLGKRPVLDLIYDFWLRGYVLVDHQTAQVRLAGEALEAHRNDRLPALKSAESNIVQVNLLQELVSGAVLPFVAKERPVGPESALVPTQRTSLDLKGIPREALIDALTEEVQRQGRIQRTERNLVVREAWVEPENLLKELERGASRHKGLRYLPILVDIFLDKGSDRLHFRVVEARGLVPSACGSVEQGLSDLSERLAAQTFFKRLRQDLQGRLDADIPRAESVSTLEKRTRDLENSNPGVVLQRHDGLLEAHRIATEHVRRLSRRAADVRLVVGYDAHEHQIRELIRGAERQLVLACPWIKMSALLRPLKDPAPGEKTDDAYLDLLRTALERGVHIFLLWGISKDEQLPSDVKTALLDLQRSSAGRLHFAHRPKPVHAKVVIQDARALLVSSYNFLDPAIRGDSLELGAVVRGRKPGCAAEATIQALEWARDLYPHHDTSLKMLMLPGDFGLEDTAPAELDDPPHPPEDSALATGSETQRATIVLWAKQWEATARKLILLEQTRAQGVSFIRDGQHRDALWDSLRHAQTRIAILSDQLSVDVVSDSFTRALDERLAEGVAASVLYRREGASDRAAGPASRLRELEDQRPALLRLLETRSHAKLLIHDDEALLGSFNFLSFEGSYDRARGRQIRSEVSVQLHDADVVHQLVEVLARKWEDTFGHLLERRSASPATEQLQSLPPNLQLLLALLKGPTAEQGERLLSWFQEAVAPWSALRELRAAGLSRNLLARCAAAALATAEDLSSPEASPWRRHLALDRWLQEDFVGAAVLVEPSDTAPLPHWLAQLGASVLLGPNAHCAPGYPTPPSEMPPVQADAAALLLVHELIVGGRFELMTVLESVNEHASRTVARWATAALEFSRQVHQPLPMDVLHHRADAADQEERQENARRAFEEALADAENVGFRFPLGQHTWDRLKARRGYLHVLRMCLEDRRYDRLSAWLDRLAQQNLNAEKLMDQASEDVRDAHAKQIVAPKRTSCLRRLNRAEDAARHWIAVCTEAPLDEQTSRILKSCVTLRQALADLPVPPGDPHPVIEPARSFLAVALEPLFKMEAS